MTSRAPARTDAAVSSRAWPVRSVTKTSARSPERSIVAAATSARSSATPRRDRPETGLMMTATDIHEIGDFVTNLPTYPITNLPIRRRGRPGLLQSEPESGTVVEVRQLDDIGRDLRHAEPSGDGLAFFHEKQL